MSVMMSLFRRSASFSFKTDTVKHFHAGRITQGFEEFYDSKVPGEAVVTGRAWTLADVRRKSFDDLHRLWFILYKERNLLITERQRKAKTTTPVIASDEFRYSKVKRSMAAIKHALTERQKINNLIKKEELAKLPANL